MTAIDELDEWIEVSGFEILDILQEIDRQARKAKFLTGMIMVIIAVSAAVVTPFVPQ